MKRTTLVLEEAVFQGIKEVSHRRGTDMSKVVNEWLSEGLRRERTEAEPFQELPSFSMGATFVNLADRDALESKMEDQ
jgi:hypothetical protein